MRLATGSWRNLSFFQSHCRGRPRRVAMSPIRRVGSSSSSGGSPGRCTGWSSRHPATNPVDGEQVPASHFGVILPWDAFDRLLARLTSRGIAFVIPPTTRFAGRRGEQRTLFVRDPAGNHLEFKTFRNPDMLFATDGLDYP